ncbi:MAG TPA: hypothetical protein VHW70_15755 [Edaphobacter sp.]|jgi:hypothetical protein|nr:hypothetical protein [Edaphobacter sp.]
MTLMTFKRESNLPAGESEASSNPEQDRSPSVVSTRVGRNKIDIDVTALKHLVETVKDKFKPEENI